LHLYDWTFALPGIQIIMAPDVHIGVDFQLGTETMCLDWSLCREYKSQSGSLGLSSIHTMIGY